MTSTASGHLILGSSNTGKSYLAISLSNSSSYPCYIINGYDDDFNAEKDEHITFQDFESDVESYYNSIMVVDDLVRPSDYEVKILNEILVKHKRHGNITLLVLAHSIERNNLHSIVKHFDFITFTNSHKNTPVVKIYAKKFCSKPYKQTMQAWDDFCGREDLRNHYFRFNVRDIRFEIIDVRGNVMQNNESKLRQDIARFIDPFSAGQLPMVLFDYIMAKVPPNTVTQDDHILTLKNSRGEKREANILDIVKYATDENNEKPPKEEIITTFHALQKICKIPYCFIRNKHFLD